jgi:hypothetical protein
VVLAKDAVEMFSASPLTVKMYVRVTWPELDDIVTSTVNVPDCVGTPEMTPVDERLMPAGKPVTNQLTVP